MAFVEPVTLRDSGIRLEPLAADSHAEIVSARGVLGGRDHLVTITPA